MKQFLNKQEAASNRSFFSSLSCFLLYRLQYMHYITASYGWITPLKQALHLKQLYLLLQSGWRGLMLPLPQELSDQWRERESSQGWGVHGESINGQIQSDDSAPTQQTHIFFLTWHTSFGAVHTACHHDAPFDHRHYDLQHVSDRHILDLHPGWCLLQVDGGARG